MKKTITSARLFRVFFTGMCALLIMSCEPDDAVAPLSLEDIEAGKAHQLSKTNTYYGPAQPIGGGVMRAMVTMTHAGEPVAIGVKISEKGLTKLPHEHVEYTLRLPNKAAMLPFDHIDVGWGPEGHEPPGLYDLPHFDIHFYMISVEEKMKIGFNDPAGEILPEPQYWPEHYFPTPGTVPMMGKHWLNELAPELRGEMFTHTFIYGSYDGAFIFYEPMITLDYLLQQKSEEFEIFQPAAFQRTGLYYPTRYSIRYDQKKKEYLIILDEMVKR